VRVAIMQPYFYPYIGYFELMARVDRLVLFDDVQFIRRGWVNRNRIRSYQDPVGWQYLTVPVARASRSARIDEIGLHEDRDWIRRQCRTLESVFGARIRTHPLYESFVACAAQATSSLRDYLERTLVETAALLGLRVQIERASRLEIDPELRGQDRVLAVCQRVGADVYVNLPGGGSLYQAESFRRLGTQLELLEPTRYRGADGRPNAFSILDGILGDGLEAVRSHLERVAWKPRRTPPGSPTVELTP
jgi:hypothetical protein